MATDQTTRIRDVARRQGGGTAVAEATNVQALLHDSAAFGPEAIRQIQAAIVGPQVQDVRRQLAELEAAIESGDASKRNLVAAGVTLHLMGRHDAAERYLAQVSGDGLAEFYRAQALTALGRFPEAADRYERAAEYGYDRVECTLKRVGAIRRLGRVADAEQLLRSIAREAATRAEYSYQMGCILADRGDRDGSIEYFERSVDMDPHHTAALFRLAEEHDAAANDYQAIKLYERALSKPPFYLGALINLGLLYEDAENYAAAAFCFRRVLQFYPDHERARLYLKDIEAASDMYYDEEAARRHRELEQLLSTPVTDFELTARARNCLERAGIETLGELTNVDEQELLAGKNFGESSLREIREMLASRGLRIGQFATPAAPTVPPPYLTEELSPQEKAELEAPVAELNLSVRARKCLTRLGITTIGELMARTPDELLSVRNFGVTSLNEIRAKLGERGMKLRND